MSVTRAAKYIAIVDQGKTITVTDCETGTTVTGELNGIDAVYSSTVKLIINAGKGLGIYRVMPDDEVTITGIMENP